MEKLNYKISINAPREKVWEKLWNDQSYSEWTSPFGEGSALVKQEWKQGGRVHFTAAGGHGMYSDIEKMTENEYISFTHLGEVKDGVELPLDEKSEQWSGWTEDYTLTETGGKTELSVQVEMDEKEAESMDKTFPKALEILKNISEAS